MVQNKHFASDNYAGVHPQIFAALAKVNSGHAEAYGSDDTTTDLDRVIAKHFGNQARAFPVFNGTGANVIALQSILPRWGSVICAETAHIHVDEAGAPERVAGIKLLPVQTKDGKLTPDLIAEKAHGYGDVHRAQPLAVSISQTTELGTCYTVKEVKEIAKTAHKHGMLLHMDGSRLSNAAAHLTATLREFTVDAGVDILSLGATKNGAMGAEAVVLLNEKLTVGADPLPVEFLRKINLHLASKMRFISAQLITLFDTDLWLESAKHANQMASLLSKKLEKNGLKLAVPTESNAVFVEIDNQLAKKANKEFLFYEWRKINSQKSEYRLMCSFDTTEEEVNELAQLLDPAS